MAHVVSKPGAFPSRNQSSSPCAADDTDGPLEGPAIGRQLIERHIEQRGQPATGPDSGALDASQRVPNDLKLLCPSSALSVDRMQRARDRTGVL